MRRNRNLRTLGVWIALAAIGCGSSERQVAVNGPPPTATPLTSAAGKENLFGSTAAGSGALTIDALAEVPTYFSACLGGSGADCTGGSLVYSGSDPGFKEDDADAPAVPRFALPDGISVSLEVIAIDPVISLQFDNGTLHTAGQVLELGTTPGIHADLEWQLLLPSGASLDAGHTVTLRLTTTSPQFAASAPFTVNVRPSTGSAPTES